MKFTTMRLMELNQTDGYIVGRETCTKKRVQEEIMYPGRCAKVITKEWGFSDSKYERKANFYHVMYTEEEA